MVADRLKTEMSPSCLKHILTIETGDKWLECDKLATVADAYMNSHFADGEPRMLASRPGGYRHRRVVGAQSENNATPPADARSENRYGDERDNRPTYETRT